MAVMTSQKTLDTTEQDKMKKKHLKSYYKTRPITATLEHPLILDINLLKKLDMTTFTKKGLIALSKFCGISLITQTDTKKKFNKSVKSNGSKKPIGDGCDATVVKFQVHLNKKSKRKQRKQITKSGSRIRFKTTEGNVSVDEDSADVVCKRHHELLMTNNRVTKSPGDVKLTDRKLIINDIINATIENIIPEPCKTCCRSEHPERFHSHPKTLTKLNLGQKTSEKNLEKVIKSANNSEKEKNKKKMEKNSSANQKASSQESLSPNEENHRNLDCDNSTNSSPKNQVKSSTSTKNSLQELEMKVQSKSFQKLGCDEKLSNGKKDGKRKNPKVGEIHREENQIVSNENALKYITGCYLCGKQVSPKMRMKHEESCILEWRTQNSLLSPDKRRPEPKRPDFRFTVTGDLDCEGTFESIWANHKESLVPCNKCGRTFFPDRIERHENCCNNAPISIKYKH